LGALLEPREGARGLGRWWKRAEVRVHRGGGNGCPVGRCARTEMVELPFIGAGEAEGVRGRHLEGRVWEFKARRVTAEVHRASPAGGVAGGPAGASHGRMRPKGDFAQVVRGRDDVAVLGRAADRQAAGRPGRRCRVAARGSAFSGVGARFQI
jgi:hypothetical protein